MSNSCLMRKGKPPLCVLHSPRAKIQRKHHGRRPFTKARTDAMGKAVIGQSPSDAVCPPPRTKVRLHFAKTIAVESADITASSPLRFFQKRIGSEADARPISQTIMTLFRSIINFFPFPASLHPQPLHCL